MCAISFKYPSLRNWLSLDQKESWSFHRYTASPQWDSAAHRNRAARNLGKSFIHVLGEIYRCNKSITNNKHSKYTTEFTSVKILYAPPPGTFNPKMRGFSFYFYWTNKMLCAVTQRQPLWLNQAEKNQIKCSFALPINRGHCSKK